MNEAAHLLRKALYYVEIAIDDWNESQDESYNRERQQTAALLADEINDHLRAMGERDDMDS